MNAAACTTPATCNLCGRPVAAPFRVYDERGKVTHGCIDAAHNGQLVTGTESARWHARPVAKQMRAKTAAHLRTIGGR